MQKNFGKIFRKDLQFSEIRIITITVTVINIKKDVNSVQAQRFSYQREQIYQAVCAIAEHPTAEMVYVRLKPELPRLSMGTVYRNLHQMAQEGRLTEISGPVARFDAVTKPHTHFSCVRCGGYFDLELPYDGALDRQAAGDGREISGHSLTFYGICPACAGKDQKQTV